MLFLISIQGKENQLWKASTITLQRNVKPLKDPFFLLRVKRQTASELVPFVAKRCSFKLIALKYKKGPNGEQVRIEVHQMGRPESWKKITQNLLCLLIVL